MERRDIRQVTELLLKFLKRFELAPSMGDEEVSHWFLPQDNIIDTFVVEVSEITICPSRYLLLIPTYVQTFVVPLCVLRVPVVF